MDKYIQVVVKMKNMSVVEQILPPVKMAQFVVYRWRISGVALLVYFPTPEQVWKLVVLAQVAVKDRVAVDVAVVVTVDVP